MKRICRSAVVIVLSMCFASALGQSAMAQRGGSAWTRFFLQPSVALAQLEEVQKELQLSDEQKELVTELNDELNDERMAIFQDSGGDRAKIREGISKLYKETAAKFNKELDEAQQKRAQEIYVQVNGPAAFQDEAIAAALKFSEEQKKKLDEARDASREEFMSAGLRDLEEEERDKKVAELVKSRDEKLRSVLTEEQRTAFDKMQGAKLKVDLSKMPVPGR